MPDIELESFYRRIIDRETVKAQAQRRLPPPHGEKCCRRCHTSKSIKLHFGKNAAMPDGLQLYCHSCRKSVRK